MKVQVTRKSVLEHYRNVVNVGYCELQFLLRYKNERFYTAGVYGWNSDVYVIETQRHRAVVVTGYRPFGNIEPSYELVSEYNTKARLVVDDSTLSYEDKIAKVDTLIDEFLDNVFC